MNGWVVPRHEVHELAPRRSDHAVVICVLDEGERILRQLQRMQAVPGLPDVLLADGGSTDGSAEPDRLAGLGVRTLLVKRDTGRLGAQQRMGFAYALQQGYDGIVSLDGNDKDGVEAIPAFEHLLREGWDFVQGSRFAPGGEARNTPSGRRLAIRLVHVPVTNLAAGRRYTDTTNAFRGYSRRLLLDPRVQPFRSAFDGYELLAYLPIRAARLGYRVTETPVRRAYPASGPVPTKISGLRGNARLLRALVWAALGRLDPR
jgi:dolichol-phosphate mannosyltransferase